jgi:hypothetical protein
VRAELPVLTSIVAGAPQSGGLLAADVNPAKPSASAALVEFADVQTARDAVAAGWRATVAPARAGVVKINQESAGLEFHVPFGGAKDSSSGPREQGKVAREFFSEWKTVCLDS